MELKLTLNKPYTENEKINFIAENNHKLGYEIREAETSLEAWGYTEEEIAQKERERIDMLSLTAADVERAIYKDKGMDFEDLIEMVRGLEEQKNSEEDESANTTELQTSIDLKALKIELKANNFYRGNPYVEKIGSLLGYSSEELDYLFENGKFAEV